MGSNNAERPGDIRCYLRSTANGTVCRLCQYQEKSSFRTGMPWKLASSSSAVGGKGNRLSKSSKDKHRKGVEMFVVGC